MGQKTVGVRQPEHDPLIQGLRTSDQVKTVNFSTDDDGNLRKLGERANGAAYIGRVRFEDGTVKRVAIKRFKNRNTGEMRSMPDDEAQRYQQAIDDLTAAGVMIPKMGMVKIRAGTILGAQQLFNAQAQDLRNPQRMDKMLMSRAGKLSYEVGKVKEVKEDNGDKSITLVGGKKSVKLYIQEAKDGEVKLCTGAERLNKDEWVQVQQLYGSSQKGSKIREVTGADENGFWINQPKNQWDDAVENWVKVANAGYHPPWEMSEAIKTRDGKLEHMPFDIDVLTWPQFKKETDEDRGWCVARNIQGLTAGDESEYRRLVKYAAEKAKPGLKEVILKHREKLGEKTPYLKEIEPWL